MKTQTSPQKLPGLGAFGAGDFGGNSFSATFVLQAIWTA